MIQTNLSVILLASIAGLFASSAQATIVTFTGGGSAQNAWRSAAGTFIFEGFESFEINTPISTLPAFGLTLDPLAGGALPGIYQHSANNTPSGQKHLANFPGNCCIVGTYQTRDLIMRVDPSVNLIAFGFWNGDPQGAAALRVYDRSGLLMGTITAAVNTSSGNSFAGFISTDPVGRLEFEGLTGDGWNHYDDFQASYSSATIPEPGTFIFVFTAVCLLLSPAIVNRARS